MSQTATDDRAAPSATTAERLEHWHKRSRELGGLGRNGLTQYLGDRGQVRFDASGVSAMSSATSVRPGYQQRDPATVVLVGLAEGALE